MPESSPLESFVSASEVARVPSADLERFWARRQAWRPWRLLFSVVAGAGALALASVMIGSVHYPRQSEIELKKVSEGRMIHAWAPAVAVSRSELGLIDMERVHAELMPRWANSLQQGGYSSAKWESELAFSALTSEAGKDPNLKALLDDLNDKASDSVTGFKREIHELFQGWNRYMEMNELPWRLEHDIVATAQGGRLYVRSYRVVADTRVSVGQQVERVRILARADKTNIGELFFGVTSRRGDGAMVMSDRVADYAIDRLWPVMVGQSNDALTPSEIAVSRFVRDEAESTMRPAAIDSLRRGARAWTQLRGMLDELEKRGGCGAGIEVPNLPWNGLNARSKRIIERAVEKNEKSGCRKLVREDQERLLAASERISSDDAFVASMEELSAWLARAVAAHEARHAADESAAHQRQQARACTTCPSSMGETERAELSAYLAAFATPSCGYVSLMQACGVNQLQAHASGAALSYALRLVLPEGCDGELPGDLYDRARQAEMELFGRSDRIVMPEAFPNRIPLGSERMPVEVADSQPPEAREASRWLMLREPKNLQGAGSAIRISSADLYVRL